MLKQNRERMKEVQDKRDAINGSYPKVFDDKVFDDIIKRLRQKKKVGIDVFK